jgi:putative tricarboxylic transport membrane protein
MMDQLLAFLTVFTDPQLLLLVGLGTFAGVYVGAIPGLSVTMAVSIPISFTFSWDVYPAISLMIGMFGVSEALAQLHHIDTPAIKQKISRIVPSFGTIRKHLPLSPQTSSIGVVIGALPGTGGDIAALMAYDHARRVTRKPEREFGDGAIEGLVAPETANNAAVGGAFIPMMTLGIPGDAVTAIMIGALFIHGLNPGPMLMIDKPDMFWFIVGALVMANVFMLIFGLTGIKLFTKIVEMPRAVLIALIMLLSIVGAYAVNNSITDVYWMFGFGVLGYFMRLYGYPLGPVILGVVLSLVLDDNWRRTIISEREDFGRFFWGNLTSPLSLALFIAVVLILLSQTPLWEVAKRRFFGQPEGAGQ